MCRDVVRRILSLQPHSFRPRFPDAGAASGRPDRTSLVARRPSSSIRSDDQAVAEAFPLRLARQIVERQNGDGTWPSLTVLS